MLCAALGGPDVTGSTPDQRETVAAVVGFEVRGTIASLGFVAPLDHPEGVSGAAVELLVIGGRSSLLHFYIPLEHVTSVSPKARTVVVDVDVVDFTPRVGEDGTVELHISG